jgi:hypothetical protein
MYRRTFACPWVDFGKFAQNLINLGIIFGLARKDRDQTGMRVGVRAFRGYSVKDNCLFVVQGVIHVMLPDLICRATVAIFGIPA